MNVETAKVLATALVMCIGALGPAMALGKIGTAALEALGRNPESESAVRTSMILALAFAEAVAIYSLVVALIIKFT